MGWKILSPLILFTIQSVFFTNAQNFDSYTTIENTFSCELNMIFKIERIVFTEKCGEILSPCYPNTYVEQLTSGFKIWDLQGPRETNASFGGYRFTINFFETLEVEGALDFATELIFNNETKLNTLDRTFSVSLSGNASGATGLRFIDNGEERSLSQGEFFDLDVQRIFISFFTSRHDPQRGFNISFCADDNMCDENVTPALCNSANGACVRNGFNNYSCVCLSGYTGEDCNTDVDECVGTPCGENARCNNTVGSFQCTCESGYTGNATIECEDIDECLTGDDNDCDDNAICNNNPGGFDCVCKNGYTGSGTTCTDIDECDDNTHNCSTNAVCDNNSGGFSCICNSGYSGNGVVCEDVDECADSADNNCARVGGNCINTVGNFTCDCLDGFIGNGVACDDVNECADDSTNNCNIAEGMCININGSFNCACMEGFFGNGIICEDVEECANSSLNDCDVSEKAICEEGRGNFSCKCKDGYDGDGRNCTDKDECFNPDDNNCDSNAECINTGGSYACTCNSGYSGTGLTCTELDECADDTHNCDANARCINTPGSFNCVCNPGYEGDGNSCTDIDECLRDADNCHGNAQCTNRVGDFTCDCLGGYTGNGTFCEDIDECTLRTDDCHSNARCTNRVPSYVCDCNSGYSGNGTFCEDDDECASMDDNNCHVNARCTNSDGSFNCACTNGYEGNGTTCTDIDECTAGTNNCDSETSAACNNTIGSFSCFCLAGYAGEGEICDDIDECTDGADNCAQNCSECSNTVGSFACSCLDGYTGNGVICTNIVECDVTPCDSNATCDDTVGSFVCRCNSGYRGDGFTCTEIDECAEDSDNCNVNAMCTNTLGSFTCTCNDGFTGNGVTCADIDECAMGLDDCNVTTSQEKCENTVGSFTCACNSPEYRGTYPNCTGYYCPGHVHERGDISFTRCTIPGIIEWPTFYDGVTTYESSKMVSWFVNLDGQTSSSAIRFTFISLSVQRIEDYIIFSDSDDIMDVENFLAVFTGTMDDILNNEAPANSTSPVGYDASTQTYTLVNRTHVYIHFFSDIQKVSTGFKIRYQPDLNDCLAESRSACQNGGTCMDLVFDYVCRDCAGYKGKHCEDDINECTLETDNCEPTKANCTNRQGGYDCTCFSQFFGDGETCEPLIRVSNLKVTVESDATSSLLSVNFDVTEEWKRNVLYVTTYVITVTNRDTGTSFNVTSNPVNSTDFLPIEFPVIPATSYDITVTYGKVGELFDKSGFVVDANSQDITIKSGSTATAAPDGLVVRLKSIFNLIVTWTRPTEEGRGIIIEYEIGYVRNASDCNLFEPIGDDIDCGSEQTIRFPGSRSDFALTGLQQYRYYDLRLRTYTSAGASEWSTITTDLTGEVCVANDTRAGAISNPCLLDRGSLSSDNFPNPYGGFANHYWQINFRGDGACKIVFDYFNLDKDEDFLFFGEGEIPQEPLNSNTDDIMNRTGDLTSATNRPQDVLYIENDKNNGLIFVIFKPDLFISAPGFQIHYETNASQCDPNPCLSGGGCIPLEFNFTCNCPSLWTGRLCSQPLVTLNTNCEGTTPGSFLLKWSVNPRWENDVTVIGGYRITYPDLPSPIDQPIGTSNYSLGGFLPFQLIIVTVEIKPPNPSVTFIKSVASCTTGEGKSTPPNSLILTSTSNTIQLTYDEPTSLNGILLGYTITFTQTDAANFGEEVIQSTIEISSASYTITGLRPFRNYMVTVAARNNAGVGETVDATIQTKAAAPQESVSGLNASDAEARTVVILFNPPLTVTGLFSYKISFVPDNGNSPISTNSTSLTISDLTPATMYNFTVTPFTSATDAGPINFVTVTTLESIPGKVNNLLVDPLSSTSIEVTWAAPNQPNGVITGYSLTWMPDGVRTDLSTATSFNITGLDVYTLYVITVYASTAVDDGEESSLSIRTLEGAPVGRVQNVVVSLQPTQVDLTITPPVKITGEFTYIIVYTVISSGVSQTVILTSTTASLSGLLPNTLYNAEVFPVSGGVNGTDGFSFNFTTPSELPGPVASVSTGVVTATSVNVNWTPPDITNGDITGYRVTWTPATPPASSPSLPADRTSYEVTGLNPYTTYTFTVLASTAQGESATPVTINVQTSEAAPSPVKDLQATAVNESSITVSFDPPSPANGVLLFYNVEIQHDVTDCTKYDQVPCDVFIRVLSAGATTARVSFEVTGLRAYRLYNVDVSANTSAGASTTVRSSVRTLSTIPGQVQDLMVNIVSSTSITVTWNASTPFAGESTYIVRATGTTTPDVVTEVVSNSTDLDEAVTLTGLPAGESYLVEVFVSTIAGNGTKQETTRLRRNTVVSGATAGISIDQTPAAGMVGFVVNNPCRDISNLFGELGGAVDSINVIVKENRAPETSPTFWANAIDMDPIPPYTAGKIQCVRQKRSLTEDELGYMIGADSACERSNTTTVCNGPLVPGKRYQASFQAENEAGLSNITQYSEEYFIPAPASTGLQPGEIAAIVICSLVVLIIIILLIVFLVRRKRQTRNRYDTSGKDNELYAQVRKKDKETTPRERFQTVNPSEPPGDPTS